MKKKYSTPEALALAIEAKNQMLVPASFEGAWDTGEELDY